jgi:hypothetical protein
VFTATNLFEKEFEKRIKSEIERVTKELSFGWHVDDYPSYKKVVGYLEALRWVESTALEEVAEIVHERTI